AARQLRGLWEISHSFARSLSLEATLDAVTKTMVELFGIDAAAIRMPDERGLELRTRAIYVADEKIRSAAETILGRPQSLDAPLAQRLRDSGEPILLTGDDAPTLPPDELLAPFLRKGATAVVLPLGTRGDDLGSLTLLSLDPTRPLDAESVDAAMTVSAQAVLAIDNARLYQQQKDFAETMQRSLIPSALPALEGLEVGAVYESSARVDVGGDVYDFLSIDERRLAVVLGDVAGKGIEAAADMAMTKYAFRALARLHPEPSDFLARVNDIVAEEVVLGKFVTLVYALIDAEAGFVACASAGHPPARVVHPDGRVDEATSRGLALGIEPGQEYPAEVLDLESGATVVLHTDGVIEARRDGELYGEVRLDAFLSAHANLPAQELAETLLADCRAYAGGDVGDDCAIVCLRLAR
ncbi:MAG: SpoIIE family protein phosphatase, partial [Actinobacteria bacterium]|nr:SpoIIE family protein phosphatase [Actinomycetota bacterium]